MLNLLLLGILPHREPAKLLLQPHLCSHCFSEKLVKISFPGQYLLGEGEV